MMKRRAPTGGAGRFVGLGAAIIVAAGPWTAPAVRAADGPNRFDI